MPCFKSNTLEWGQHLPKFYVCQGTLRSTVVCDKEKPKHNHFGLKTTGSDAAPENRVLNGVD